jgi:hypothetical protein
MDSPRHKQALERQAQRGRLDSDMREEELEARVLECKAAAAGEKEALQRERRAHEADAEGARRELASMQVRREETSLWRWRR